MIIIIIIIIIIMYRWRDWSGDRFMTCWGLFLEKDDSKQDSQYNLIKGLYEQVKQKADVNKHHTNPQNQAM
jgi:hypothetical protein